MSEDFFLKGQIVLQAEKSKCVYFLGREWNAKSQKPKST